MEENVGKLVITTEVSDKELQKNLRDQKKQLEKHEKEAKELLELKAQYEANIKPLEEEQKQIAKTREYYENLKKKIKEVEEQRRKIEELPTERQRMEAYKENTPEYYALLKERSQLDKVAFLGSFRDEEITKELAEQKQLVSDIDDKLEQNVKKQEQITQNIQQANAELQKRSVLDGINNSINNIGKSMTRITKKVGRWALAIFGIRGAYMAVRNAINVLSQDDEKLKSDITYMKNVFAYALEPVVRRIVDLVKLMLAYIGYIIKAWFKYDIFANANKHLKSANKSANELRKTIAGFDEMNILGDNVGSSGGLDSGIGGIDLPKVDDNSILKWIANNKDLVLGALSAITAGLIALKLSGFDPIVGILGAILGFGIYTFITGIIQMIKDPSWENFGRILEGLGVIIASITAILMVIGVASGPIAWIILAIGSLIGMIGVLMVELTRNRDGIKSVEDATNDLNDAKLALSEKTLNYTRAVKEEKKAHEELARVMRETGISQDGLNAIIEKGNKNYTSLTDAEKKIYDAYLNLEVAQGRVTATLKEKQKAEKEETKQAIETELANAKKEKSYEKLKKTVIEAYNNGKISAKEASEYISRAMANMSYNSMKTFSKDIPDSIREGLDPYKYKTKMDKLKAWWNGEIARFNREIKITWSVSNGSIDEIRFNASFSSGKYFAKGGIYYPSNLPKLASGGIINQPGRGVPYHGAVIAERGAEAILPLTDSQQMQMLGETIGRFVSINATVPVYVGNRMVVREMKRIEAEDSFASNR